MLQVKEWLEYKWNNEYTILIEKKEFKGETFTDFWLRKKNFGVIDFMFGVEGNLTGKEIANYIKRNIYAYIEIFENTYE